jgi:DNA-binding LacI/PurR family transcriptional regulator
VGDLVSSKPPTMREVADLAGVSVQTVSHVVNKTGSIGADTRDRVAQIIERVNFRPNLIARSMRTRETGLIGILVLDITSPVLCTIASEIEGVAYARGHKVLLYDARHDARLLGELLEQFADQLVDGLIVVNAIDRGNTLPWLKASTIPTVLVDCLPNPTVASVAMDNERGAYIATVHLIELGHERIAHIAGDLALEVARQRLVGYARALADHGLQANERVVSPDSDRWNYRSGYVAMKELLARPPMPSAVFIAADQMAIGAQRALAEAGLEVPDDVSLVGFDDIEAASYAWPPLTTIRQPLTEIGARAFDLLSELLTGAVDPVKAQVTLQPELVVRGSTRRIA